MSIACFLSYVDLSFYASGMYVPFGNPQRTGKVPCEEVIFQSIWAIMLKRDKRVIDEE